METENLRPTENTLVASGLQCILGRVVYVKLYPQKVLANNSKCMVSEYAMFNGTGIDCS